MYEIFMGLNSLMIFDNDFPSVRKYQVKEMIKVILNFFESFSQLDILKTNIFYL